MRLALIALSLFAGFAAAAQAKTYQAANRLAVVALNNSDFEVIEARGEGARGIWCAAADYTITDRHMGSNQRIYVKSPRGPSANVAGKIGVVFTTNPARLSQGPSKSYSISVRTVGQGLTAAHAIQFCRDNAIEPDDILYRRKGN
jgi:hypothetical protein